MSRIIVGDPVAAFVSERVNDAFFPPFTAIGVEQEGAIVAGAVFNCFTGPDIHVTVAADPGGITREFVRACGRYVFEINGCERATFVTEQPLVVNLAQRLAAQTEGRMRNHFGPGRDGIVLGLLKSDWKF